MSPIHMSSDKAPGGAVGTPQNAAQQGAGATANGTSDEGAAAQQANPEGGEEKAAADMQQQQRAENDGEGERIVPWW